MSVYSILQECRLCHALVIKRSSAMYYMRKNWENFSDSLNHLLLLFFHKFPQNINREKGIYEEFLLTQLDLEMLELFSVFNI